MYIYIHIYTYRQKPEIPIDTLKHLAYPHTETICNLPDALNNE